MPQSLSNHLSQSSSHGDPRMCALLRIGWSSGFGSAIVVGRHLQQKELSSLLSELTPIEDVGLSNLEFLSTLKSSSPEIVNQFDVVFAEKNSLDSLCMANNEWMNFVHSRRLIVLPLSRLPGETLSEQSDFYYSSLLRPYGLISYSRKKTDSPVNTIVTLHSSQPFQPHIERSSLWPNNPTDSEIFIRTYKKNLKLTLNGLGVFIARADAADKIALAQAACVWTAGMATWKKLVQLGIWVNGSCEGLGELERPLVEKLIPLSRWVKLSHDSSPKNNDDEVFPTYTLNKIKDLPDLSSFSHFFWKSGSLFREAIKEYPQIIEGWHGCGPGNTFDAVQQHIPLDRIKIFLSYEDWKKETINADKTSPATSIFETASRAIS